jgi:Putative MetA-pathway of phenol degradation
MEPRAYSPSPVGVNFLVLAAAQSQGGVLFDPSLPFTDVDARLNVGALAYGRTFGVLGHAASVSLAAPYVTGTVSGNVGETRRTIHRSGLADARLRLSVSLIGAPAETQGEFVRRTPRNALGASLTIVPPTGQYASTKLINIGSNRWSFKPELGASFPLGRWYLEGYAGVWLFTENTEFFGDTRRRQEPIASLQGHLSYTLRPRLWLAFDATYYTGGRTTVDDTRNADLQSNSRVGLTLSVPVTQQQSLKFSWTKGATTRVGADFITYGIAWQYAWFD